MIKQQSEVRVTMPHHNKQAVQKLSQFTEGREGHLNRPAPKHEETD